MTETLDFTALDQFLGIKRLAADTAPASPLGSPVAWRRPKQHVARLQIGNEANDSRTVRTATGPNNRHSHGDKT